ncbi:MAG: Peroxiredoxin [Patescibacteria group bacterium]|jgi:peroxiredoxin|nr:Peroxiredoxin [Patescibacteria group bacterium]
MSTNTPLASGAEAPGFKLRDTPDQDVSLKELRGRPVVLMFYPADFSPICGSEVSLFNEILPELQKHAAQLLGISVDSAWCHLAFARENNLRFPLLADFHPKGEVARRYQSYRESEGEAERALYVIDKDGLIAWSYISPVGVNPGAEGVLKALEGLSGKVYED